MHNRKLVALAVAILIVVLLSLLSACGSSTGGTQTQSSTPVFTSAPVTTATQDIAYAYQVAATDPAGGSVTFSLTASPTGAALNGSMVAWTPAAAQSRVSNSFTVKATTASGGTASQSWTVTPGGTITVNWVNTYWTASGQVLVPADPSEAVNLSALVTNPDGSITVQKSSATSPGVFSIPNVPAGYYWLQAGSGNFWTNTSTFDAGNDIAGPLAPTTGNSQNTSATFNLSGLDPVGQQTNLDFVVPVVSGLGYPGITFGAEPPQTNLFFPDVPLSPTIDWSKIDSAFFLQYVPESLGSLNNLVIGPSVDASLSLTDGQLNTITETLQPSPQASVNLSVPGGSQWAPLFTTDAAPAAPIPYSSALSISAQAYISGRLASGTGTLPNIGAGSIPSLTLAGTTSTNTNSIAGCVVQEFNPNPQPAISTDENFGALQYGDPFPSTWTRILSLCQLYTVAIPVPNSSATASFALVDGASVPPSGNVTLAPVVSIVQNPNINGASFFTAATINTTEVPLNWSAPTGAAPYGYTVRAYVLSMTGGTPAYNATGGIFSVAQTSITLPPLSGGNTYIFAIAAEANGTANIQTSPFRSSLPTGYATIISAPITISSGATAPAIHGDRRAITRLSEAQLPVTQRPRRP